VADRSTLVTVNYRHTLVTASGRLDFSCPLGTAATLKHGDYCQYRGSGCRECHVYPKHSSHGQECWT